MKYAVDMGSGAMIYISSFKKIGSGIQKLMGGIHRQHGDLISLLSFFQNNESGLKMIKIDTELLMKTVLCHALVIMQSIFQCELQRDVRAQK
jgi:hypothetical protein